MNNPEHGDQSETGGPNLKIIYGLIVLALVAAIAVAALIVFPFYLRH